MLHCFGARFAMLFDLVLNPVEQRIKFTIWLKQRVIRGNHDGRRQRTSCPLKGNQRCSFAGHRISCFLIESSEHLSLRTTHRLTRKVQAKSSICSPSVWPVGQSVEGFCCVF